MELAINEENVNKLANDLIAIIKQEHAINTSLSVLDVVCALEAVNGQIAAMIEAQAAIKGFGGQDEQL